MIKNHWQMLAFIESYVFLINECHVMINDNNVLYDNLILCFLPGHINCEINQPQTLLIIVFKIVLDFF